MLNLVDTIAGGLFGSQDVLDAWAGAAGKLIEAAFKGDLSSVLPEVIADLRANSVIDAAIDATVTDAIETLFGDTGLWDALQSAVVGLASEVLGDSSVQDAVSDQVQQLVSSALGGGALGEAVGAQVGAAVVGLITNPVTGDALLGLVDTIAGGLFGSSEVVDVWAGAAGKLIEAAFKGDLSSVLPEVITSLRANKVIDTAIDATVRGQSKTCLVIAGCGMRCSPRWSAWPVRFSATRRCSRRSVIASGRWFPRSAVVPLAMRWVRRSVRRWSG